MKDNSFNGSVANEEKVSIKDVKTKDRPIAEMSLISDITFERFMDSDMNKFTARVVGTERKVFAPKDYMVEITISNIPPFQVGKTFNEFKAFYKALKLRFTNIPWPDFPSHFALFKKKTRKKEVFNQILSNIYTATKIKNKHSKALLGIFFAFFLDKDLPNLLKKHNSKPVPSPNKNSSVSATNEDSLEADASKIEGALEEGINELERKYTYILSKSTEDLNNSSFNDSRDNDRSFEATLKSSGENKQDSAPPSPETKTRQEGNSSLEEQKKVESIEAASPDKLSTFSDGSRREKVKEKVKDFMKKTFKSTVEDVPEETNDRKSLRVSIGNEVEAGLDDDKKKKKEKKKEEKEEKDFAPRRRARGVSAATAKEIPNFCGEIHMKFASDKKWIKYFARINSGCLVLYKSILENTPLHTVPLYSCGLKYITNQETLADIIELWHNYDADIFQICLSPDNEEDKKEDINLGNWHDQLKLASQKTNHLNLLTKKYTSIGKYQVVIYNVVDMKGLANNSSCFVRLSHPPFTLSTGKTLKNDNMKFKQSFFLPIFDQYFPISLEVVAAYNDGWLKENQKEEVICTGELLVADIISLKANNVLTTTIPMKYTELKLKALTKGCAPNESDLPAPKLEVRIKNLSSMASYFAPVCDDYVEGVRIDDDTWSKQLIKLSIARGKRIFTYLSLQAEDLKTIFNFKYPVFSYLCLMIFTWIGFHLEIADLIPNIILLTVLACIYHHPKVHGRAIGVMGKLFFGENRLNPHYIHPRVQTMRDVEIKKFMNTEKWKYRLVDPESLMSIYKRSKAALVDITVFLTRIMGLFEKFKNIVTWRDPIRTEIYILIGTIGYCLLSVISFRMLILLGIWGNFARGITFYKNLQKKNKEAAEHALRLTLKESYSEYYPQIFGNLTSPWPTMPNFNTFETRIVERMRFRLNVNLPDNILRMENTPAEFFAMISTASRPLKLKMSPEEETMLHIYKKKAPKYGAKTLLNFLLNVPSDYYRVVHPRVIPYEELSQGLELPPQLPQEKEKQE